VTMKKSTGKTRLTASVKHNMPRTAESGLQAMMVVSATEQRRCWWQTNRQHRCFTHSV